MAFAFVCIKYAYSQYVGFNQTDITINNNYYDLNEENVNW